jgi:hypothetical protein
MTGKPEINVWAHTFLKNCSGSPFEKKLICVTVLYCFTVALALSTQSMVMIDNHYLFHILYDVKHIQIGFG